MHSPGTIRNSFLPTTSVVGNRITPITLGSRFSGFRHPLLTKPEAKHFNPLAPGYSSKPSDRLITVPSLPYPLTVVRRTLWRSRGLFLHEDGGNHWNNHVFTGNQDNSGTGLRESGGSERTVGQLQKTKNLPCQCQQEPGYLQVLRRLPSGRCGPY